MRSIIVAEMNSYNQLDVDRSAYIKDVILKRFDRKFYTGMLRKSLYADLRFATEQQLDSFKSRNKKASLLSEQEETNEKLRARHQKRNSPSRTYARILVHQFFMNLLYLK